MNSASKRKALAFLAGTLILTVLLAMALPRVEFQPGLPLPAWSEATPEPEDGQKPEVNVLPETFWKALVALIVAAVVLYNAYLFLRRPAWGLKDILRSILFFTLLLGVLAAILFAVLSRAQPSSEIGFEAPPATLAPPGPPLESASPGLLLAVGVILAAAMVGLGAWILLRPERRTGADRLILPAELALQALRQGVDLRNVILRCYWDMEQVLKEEQGIEKERGMTVREFENFLTERGWPPAPVHQLTRLFETVRYSQGETSADEERLAAAALTDIAGFSRTRKPEPSA
jgi:hypothetical protein